MPNLKRLRLLVTAGPTREMLDPVRFLSNVSTGQMGYAVAREARHRGFQVTLVSGPVTISKPAGVTFVPVLTAEDMKRAISRFWPRTDILIMTAAVCDYTPVHFSPTKIKRIKQRTIRFKRTPDILEFLGKRKGKRLMVGFALETEDVQKNALRKLKQKNLDLIVANWYGKANYPFGKSRFSAIFINSGGDQKRLNHVSKEEAAKALLREVVRLIQKG